MSPSEEAKRLRPETCPARDRRASARTGHRGTRRDRASEPQPTPHGHLPPSRPSRRSAPTRPLRLRVPRANATYKRKTQSCEQSPTGGYESAFRCATAAARGARGIVESGRTVLSAPRAAPAPLDGAPCRSKMRFATVKLERRPNTNLTSCQGFPGLGLRRSGARTAPRAPWPSACPRRAPRRSCR